MAKAIQTSDGSGSGFWSFLTLSQNYSGISYIPQARKGWHFLYSSSKNIVAFLILLSTYMLKCHKGCYIVAFFIFLSTQTLICHNGCHNHRVFNWLSVIYQASKPICQCLLNGTSLIACVQIRAASFRATRSWVPYRMVISPFGYQLQTSETEAFKYMGCVVTCHPLDYVPSNQRFLFLNVLPGHPSKKLLPGNVLEIKGSHCDATPISSLHQDRT